MQIFNEIKTGEMVSTKLGFFLVRDIQDTEFGRILHCSGILSGELSDAIQIGEGDLA
tara:strand:- start:5475 stop:5645 length:171 start_codon:yes stop_codon:yes gene_type:complete